MSITDNFVSNPAWFGDLTNHRPSVEKANAPVSSPANRGFGCGIFAISSFEIPNVATVCAFPGSLAEVLDGFG
ncbi:MAG: hypothetical protein MUF18_05325, partial [Fimbriiglobus sp.]|nr:hypothetical protein [Fimbriiglobus sp.]